MTGLAGLAGLTGQFSSVQSLWILQALPSLQHSFFSPQQSALADFAAPQEQEAKPRAMALATINFKKAFMLPPLIIPCE